MQADALGAGRRDEPAAVEQGGDLPVGPGGRRLHHDLDGIPGGSGAPEGPPGRLKKGVKTLARKMTSAMP